MSCLLFCYPYGDRFAWDSAALAKIANDKIVATITVEIGDSKTRMIAMVLAEDMFIKLTLV